MSNQLKAVFQQVTAEAPAGIGNVAVGFDLLGQALAAPHDRVRLTVREAKGVEIVAVTGVVRELPSDPGRNAATAGIERMLNEHGAQFGVAVEIHKGISIGSGMGGSAASAVAGVVAADALMGLSLSKSRLLGYALDGEEAATGARHADNISSALCGGLTLVTPRGSSFNLQQLPPPDGVYSVLVHPHILLETRASRAALPESFARKAVIEQTACLAGFLTACFTNDLELVRSSLRDVLIEPYRASLVPGFDKVKKAALEEGALGCSISGGGPSVFAWFESEDLAQSAGAAMRDAFEGVGIESDIWISPLNVPGARLVA